MRLGVAMPQSVSADESVVIKIYKIEGKEQNLVRRYTSVNDVPDYLALLNGNYVAKVQVGDKHIVSFDDKYYVGESSFTISSGNVTTVTVDCKLQSTIVYVKYDATVVEKLDQGFFTNVSVAESYDAEAIATGDVHSLNYEETKEGYFVLPADQTTLFWHFEGKHPDEEGGIVKEGKIENVMPSTKYTLSMKYSKDAPGGLIIEATVDESIEEFDDTLIFSPDPTVVGDGFNEKDTQLSINTRTYNIASLANISKLAISADGVEYNLLNGGVNGVQLTKTDDMNYKVVVAPEFFNVVAGGNNAITFNVEDVDGGKIKKNIQYNVQGILPLNASDYDLWYGNVTFKANVLDSAVTSVKVAYSADGTTWTEVDATASNGYYTAEGTGFAAEKNYSYKLIIDSKDAGKALTHATAAGAQLPNSDFEEWSDNYTPGGLWSSGNNSFTKDLLSKNEAGRTGNCAKAQSKSAAGKFAAGNLFTGNFLGIDMSSMSGRVQFGKSFTFTARPKSFSFYMKNKQGEINQGSGNPASGTDVYSAIVLITDGETYTVDTTDKSTFITFDNLKDLKGVIAYGYVSGQDSNSDWTLKTVELTYVDNWASMTPNKVSVSFSPSGYGDYFCGSTESNMFIDDVRFNY